MIDNGAMRLISALAGTLLLLLTVASILRTLVVPRGLYSTLTFRLWQFGRAVLHLCATPFGTYRAQDRAQAWLAPLMLVAMLFCWLLALLGAFTLLMEATSGLPWDASFREAAPACSPSASPAAPDCGSPASTSWPPPADRW